MSELISALALLCQVSTGVTPSMMDYVDRYQMRCQKYYAACIERKIKEGQVDLNALLFQCIKERNI